MRRAVVLVGVGAVAACLWLMVVHPERVQPELLVMGVITGCAAAVIALDPEP